MLKKYGNGVRFSLARKRHARKLYMHVFGVSKILGGVNFGG